MKFSEKQRFVFRWWCDKRYSGFDGIICDGAVRSGKTYCMSFSFGLWAMKSFSGEMFGLCGKTLGSVRRNLGEGMMKSLKSVGFKIKDFPSRNYFEVSDGRRKNRFCYFSGKDEGSAAMIQGVTLAGVLFDETALMPRSFVEQACARCSVSGAKLWFNCNPDNPYHWFKREWIDKAQRKNLLYCHFTIYDNPTLDRTVTARYKRLYSGAFYERFVMGRWTAAEGLVYPMFDSGAHTYDGEREFERYVISCDYGTVNPSSFGLWGKCGEIWYRIDEYYYDSAREGLRRTDEEHYAGLCDLAGGRKIEYVVCDPSAASFIQCIERHGEFHVRAAKNDVVWGIRKVSDFIRSGKLRVNVRCEDCIREFSMYRWDESAGRDSPIKENDHAMDDLRYFVTSLDEGEDGFMVMTVSRSLAVTGNSRRR
jgi:PBSX family phage terminase large subunit